MKKDNLITIGVSLIVLSTFNFYFFDPFYYPILKSIFILFGFFFLVVSINPQKVSFGFLLFCSYLFIYNYSGFFTNFFRQEFSSLYITGLFFILFFIYSENIDKKSILFNSLNFVISSFVIVNTISFFVFILFIIKVPLSHVTIDLGGRGFLYNNYVNILIVCNYVTVDFGQFVISRFNGLFEEPGMLGTYIGIILMVDIILFPHKKLRKVILIILGIFTTSFALYIYFFLVLIYYLSIKRLLILTLLFTISLFIIINFVPKTSLDYINGLTIDRVTVKNGQLVGDSRHNDNVKFANYLNNIKTGELIFGNGKGSNNEKNASYSSFASYIYESGIFGFVLFVLLNFYYLIYIPVKYRQYKFIILTIFPIISICQSRQAIEFFTILSFISFKYYFEHKCALEKFMLAKKEKINLQQLMDCNNNLT